MNPTRSVMTLTEWAEAASAEYPDGGATYAKIAGSGPGLVAKPPWRHGADPRIPDALWLVAEANQIPVLLEAQAARGSIFTLAEARDLLGALGHEVRDLTEAAGVLLSAPPAEPRRAA